MPREIFAHLTLRKIANCQLLAAVTFMAMAEWRGELYILLWWILDIFGSNEHFCWLSATNPFSIV